MNEENFSLQSSLEGNYLNIALPQCAKLDEIAIRVMEEDCPEFLIPFRIVTVNGNSNLRYKLINTVALAYSERNLSKQQFVKLFMDLLFPFIQGKDWFLDYHNLCIDPRYVFINKMNQGISFIYVPESSFRFDDQEIKKFLKNLFTEITILDDPSFQVTMFRYFGKDDSNLADLYQILLQEQKNTGMGQTVVPHYATQQTNASSVSRERTASIPADIQAEREVKNGNNFSLSGGKKESEPEKTVKQAPKSISILTEGDNSIARLKDISDSEAAVNILFGDTSKKKKEIKEKKEKEGGIFSFFNGKKKEKDAITIAPSNANPVHVQSGSQPFIRQTLTKDLTEEFSMVSASSDDRTEISDEEYRGGACLELIESAIPGAIPRISLEFEGPYILIGRTSSDEVQPDIAFSRDFSRIGRRHARIEKNGNGYCIIDLGSANHTVVNNQVLIPNQPYPLQDGGEVIFTTSKPVKYRIHL